jgi:hypothetical protein
MEMLQEIGSYAGFAAVVGLAVLSALYFSQARDVKRLREWAGRAPERGPTQVEPRRVVAQPVPKPPQAPGGQQLPPVPRPPGAQPGSASQPAVAQSAAGAAPAVAMGPAAATPAAAAQAASAPSAADEEEELTPEGESAAPAASNGDAGEGADENEAALADDPEAEGDEPSAEGDDEADATPDDSAPDADDAHGATSVHQETDEWDPVESGEWRPEDEHSELDLADEEGEEDRPRTPTPGLHPPAPPQPFRPAPPRPRAPLRTGPSGAGSAGRGQILPPYSESRNAPDAGRAGDPRRTAFTVGGIVLVLAIAIFAVVQVTGGDDDPVNPVKNAPQSTPAGADGDQEQAPIDPSSVTVAVLNGTLVPGLAAQMGDKLRGQEFKVGTVTNNYDQELAESVVLYAPGAEREAADVARRLDIPQREAIDPDSQGLAGDASVVVVTGADLTQ